MSSRSLPIPTRLLGVTLCLALSALSTAYAATSLFGNSYAVVIGIDDYKHSRVWPDLPYANKDARGMATFLQNQGFEVRTLYDREATQRAIISALEDHLAPRLKENDRVLFFFSGHGETRPYGNEDHGYIVPQDGDKWPSTWISMEKLRELAWKMGAARHQLFIFDACFGGLFAAKGPLSTRDPDMPGYIEAVSKDKARQYLTAGGAREKVRAGGPKGYSYFTGYLLEALKQGKADTYRDGYITASELVAWLEPAASNPDHTPRGGTLGGHEQGDFLFQSPFPAAARAKEPTGPFVGLKAGAREDVVPVEEPYLAVKNARIRARPTVQSDTVGIIKKDSRVWVAGQVRNQEWYLVEHAETKVCLQKIVACSDSGSANAAIIRSGYGHDPHQGWLFRDG